MLTRRELMFAAGAAALAPTEFLVADDKAVLSSAVFNLDSFPDKKNDNGSARQILRQPTPTLQELEIHVTTLLPNHAPHAPHRHGHEEVLIIREGSIETFIDGSWKPAGPGAIVFFAANQLHGARNTGTVPAVYHVIAFRTNKTPPDAQ